MNNFSPEQLHDIKILIKFTLVYCQALHPGAKIQAAIPAPLQNNFRKGVNLCPDCQTFLAYALQKRSQCPLDPKPSCKHCHIHCYSSEYRQKVRKVMSFSGRRMILRGRIDYLWHYFF
jgi:Nitrous oxide-stimulated promoter